jgi:hypothetical protein
VLVSFICFLLNLGESVGAVNFLRWAALPAVLIVSFLDSPVNLG